MEAIIVKMQFDNDEEKDIFLDFSESEKTEFINDFRYLMKKTKEIMLKENIFAGTHNSSQRIGERYFNVELYCDFTTEDPIIIFKQFTEVDVNTYLDYMNESKKMGGIKINANEVSE
jgi:hypothetical protein